MCGTDPGPRPASSTSHQLPQLRPPQRTPWCQDLCAAPPSHPMPQPRPTNLFSRQQPAKYSIGLHQHKGKRSDAPEQEATGTHQATRKFLGLCSRLRLVNAIATSPCLSHTRGTPRAQQIAAGSSSHCRGWLDRRTKAPINEGTSYEARAPLATASRPRASGNRPAFKTDQMPKTSEWTVSNRDERAAEKSTTHGNGQDMRTDHRREGCRANGLSSEASWREGQHVLLSFCYSV